VWSSRRKNEGVLVKRVGDRILAPAGRESTHGRRERWIVGEAKFSDASIGESFASPPVSRTDSRRRSLARSHSARIVPAGFRRSEKSCFKHTVRPRPTSEHP